MFKELLNLEFFHLEIQQINESLEAIDEFGYVCVHSDSQQAIRDKAKLALSKIEEARNILDELHKEMQDWYSY